MAISAEIDNLEKQALGMLEKIEGKWKFESEADLENFVWTHLKSLLSLKPLKRQYSAKGEWCDILALDENRQLVILELKNTEDRYVVQQLTRYYDNLLEEKPFETEIDYRLPIRLVAITPSFHRHNLLDQKHHKLDFEFLLFEVIQERNQLYLSLKNINQELISRLTIHYPEEKIIDETENIDSSITILPTPKALQKALENESTEKQNIILKIREKILRFDERIGEKSTAVTTTYGKKKVNGQLVTIPSKFLGGFQKPSSSPNLELFLYLPFTSYSRKKIIKMIVRTDNWLTVSGVDLPYEQKRMYQAPGQPLDIEYYLTTYERITGKPAKSKSLDALVDMALEDWRERV